MYVCQFSERDATLSSGVGRSHPAQPGTIFQDDGQENQVRRRFKNASLVTIMEKSFFYLVSHLQTTVRRAWNGADRC